MYTVRRRITAQQWSVGAAASYWVKVLAEAAEGTAGVKEECGNAASTPPDPLLMDVPTQSTTVSAYRPRVQDWDHSLAQHCSSLSSFFPLFSHGELELPPLLPVTWSGYTDAHEVWFVPWLAGAADESEQNSK